MRLRVGGGLWRSGRAARGAGLARLPRRALPVPGWYSADEVLTLHQRLAGSTGAAAERSRLLELVGLIEARDRKVDAMSKGMQQRLGIAQALVGDPPPSSWTSRRARSTRPAAAPSAACSRNCAPRRLRPPQLPPLSEVELVCDRVVIITRGAVVAAGAPSELARPRGVEVETGNGVRHFPDAGREDRPRIVAELVTAGEAVYGVRVLRIEPEDEYLIAVGDDST